ncbi:hypothetical protein [Paenibacillus sp. GCM10027626]|uniref:hypothetical protein n=1 Tax=Paenibacillus sp. GCM10027626 TaxID=3273411 RepID=UPI003629A19E
MIMDLFKKLTIIIPDDVLEKLEIHSKNQKVQEFYFRLMELEEILETTDFLSSIEVYQNIIPLWTDDNSNYIGFHFQGACTYKISYLNHEETDLSPGFRSINSFITELELHPNLDWDELGKTTLLD